MELLSRYQLLQLFICQLDNMKKHFLVFVLINILFFVFIAKFHNLTSFNSLNYVYAAHHYFSDPQASGKPFNLLRSLGQYDAQWYLKIASSGYPFHPKINSNADKRIMDGLTYAFFPLYPMLIRLVSIAFGNIELSAFSLSIVLLIANFFSLYFVTGRLFSKSLAIKSILLIFLFPFSVFFRSYFTEGLYLFLLIWFSYFLIRKKLLLAAIALGLLNMTKGSGLLLDALYLYVLWKEVKEKKTSLANACKLIVILVVPFLLWMLFCFIQTGNPLYFYTVRSAWYNSPIPPLLYNFSLLFLFPFLPVHSFHYSQIDILVVLIASLILMKSRKFLGFNLWWIAFILWINPLLASDTMSFTRYQSVSFPLFIYIANILPNKLYWLVLLLFAIGFAVVSLFFVNWWWIG